MVADDVAVLTAFPHAAIDHDNLEFYRGLLARRFLVNRCADCGHWHVPPRPICPACWSTRVVPTEISGRGVVHMVVWMHQGAPPVGDDALPYPLATVELVEQLGLRISTVVIGASKDDLTIGLPLELTWVERDGVPHPVFRPADVSTVVP